MADVPTPSDDTGWTQVGLRRLSDGDYVRICVKNYDRQIRVQRGTVPPDKPDQVLWNWVNIMTPEDVQWAILDLAYAAVMAEKNTAGVIMQLEEQKHVPEGF
jgi:hypothetical protein